jgi:hypothetical protein
MGRSSHGYREGEGTRRPAHPAVLAVPLGPRWGEAMRDDSIPDELLVAAAQEALRDLNRTPDNRAVLDTLVACDILVPEPVEFVARHSPEDGRLTLPVIDDPPQPHTVPVFTSVERMLQTLPDIRLGHQVQLGLLAANWPTDEELALAIDLGHPDAVIFAGPEVHDLLVPPWR